MDITMDLQFFLIFIVRIVRIAGTTEVPRDIRGFRDVGVRDTEFYLYMT